MYLCGYLLFILLGALQVFAPKFNHEFKFCWQKPISISVRRNITHDRFLNFGFFDAKPFCQTADPKLWDRKQRSRVLWVRQKRGQKHHEISLHMLSPTPIRAPKIWGGSVLPGSGQQPSEPLFSTCRAPDRARLGGLKTWTLPPLGTLSFKDGSWVLGSQTALGDSRRSCFLKYMWWCSDNFLL